MDLSSLLSSLPQPPSPAQPVTALLSSLSTLIGSCPDSTFLSVVAKLEQLFTSPACGWQLSSANCSPSLEREVELGYLSLTCALIGRCTLPLADDDVSSVVEAEYNAIRPRVKAVNRALIALLGILGKSRAEGGNESERGEIEKEGGGVLARILFTVAPDICVFAVTHFQVAPWSSPSSRADAQEVMRALLGAGAWTDSAHLLVGDRKQREDGQSVGAMGIMGAILDLLQPQLSKESMFRSDAVKLVFSWALLQVTRPDLSQHLPRLLSPSLLLTDHYRPENCILGVRCLHHIVLHTAAADLRQLNRAEVLYQAVFRLLYNSQAQVTQCVLSCLMDLLLVLEKAPSSPASSPSTRAANRHDAVLRLVLTQMEAEHKLALRRVYASALPPLVDRCGIAVCRHMKRLERVILGYLELSDPPDETSRIQTLHTLNRTLKTAWPRVDQKRALQLLRAVLRLLLEVSSDSNLEDSVKQEIFVQSAASIRLLDACSNGTLQCLLLQVDSSHCSPDVLQVLHSATTQTPT
ncbi:TELO2-interacting protein 2 [Eucyclogobius newberryi]|uniref:TELO2-interacting protein 2 n=1 Tax=Eucyclogobius newberryi TaxID=166745 RepID=UPI003B5C130E